jgi:hypothetical protein
MGNEQAPTVVKSLHSNAKSSCETGDSQRGQKPLNMEAEGATVLGAITRQLVKTAHWENFVHAVVSESVKRL